jgi:hypothetical protein
MFHDLGVKPKIPSSHDSFLTITLTSLFLISTEASWTQGKIFPPISWSRKSQSRGGGTILQSGRTDLLFLVRLSILQGD